MNGKHNFLAVMVFTICSFFVSSSAFADFNLAGLLDCLNPYGLCGAWPANNDFYDNSGVAYQDFFINPYTVSSLHTIFTYTLPGLNGVDSTPAIANDGTIYIADGGGGVTALNGQTGAVIWQDHLMGNNWANHAPYAESFDESPVISQGMLFIAEDNMYGINRYTGQVLWSTPVYDLMNKLTYSYSNPTTIEASQLMLAGNNVVMGLGFSDEANSCSPITACTNYPNEHGEIIAFNQMTGKVDWRDDLTYVNGVQYAGGSGTFGQAAVDPLRQMLYLGTSNAYEGPTSPYSDALLAINYNTGKIVWYFQFYKNDVWNGSIAPVGMNDLDVRGHPQLFSLPNQYRFGETDYVSITGKDGSLRIFTRDQPNENVNGNDPAVLAKPVVQAQLVAANSYDGGIQLNPAIANGIMYVPITALFSSSGAEETLDDAGSEIMALLGPYPTGYTPETRIIAINLQQLVAYGLTHNTNNGPGGPDPPGSNDEPACYGTFTPPLCTLTDQLPNSAGILYDVNSDAGVPVSSSGAAYDNGVLFIPGAIGTVTAMNAQSGNIITIFTPAAGTPNLLSLPYNLIVGGISIQYGKMYVPFGLDYVGIVIGSGGVVGLGLPGF